MERTRSACFVSAARLVYSGECHVSTFPQSVPVHGVVVLNLFPHSMPVVPPAPILVYGPVAEVKLHKKGGYGFVKFEHHKSAVKAIVGQHGKDLDGRVSAQQHGAMCALGGNAKSQGGGIADVTLVLDWSAWAPGAVL